MWDDRDLAVFQATAERGEEGVPRKGWAAYVDHVRATVPEERERERKLTEAATICAEIGFAGRLIREAREARAAAASELAKLAECAASRDGAAREDRAEVERAQAQVKRWESYLLAIQAVQRNLANGNILAAFVNAFTPPILQTPPQVKAKVNGRPPTYDQRFAEGRARWLWMEDPKLPVLAVVNLLIKGDPAEFADHKHALRKHLGNRQSHLRPPPE